MAVYVILSAINGEGHETIKRKTERILEVDEELESIGVKVHQQCAVFGKYDCVSIVQAPDIEAVLKISGNIGAGGSVRLRVLTIYIADDAINQN